MRENTAVINISSRAPRSVAKCIMLRSQPGYLRHFYPEHLSHRERMHPRRVEAALRVHLHFLGSKTIIKVNSAKTRILKSDAKTYQHSVGMLNNLKQWHILFWNPLYDHCNSHSIYHNSMCDFCCKIFVDANIHSLGWYSHFY